MKICPLMLQGRSKGELGYIRGNIERDPDTVQELSCLKFHCAWWNFENSCCAITVIGLIGER